jgi:type IV pilus assembly protein PilC
MQFHYIAAQPDGKILENNLEAENPAAVLEQLSLSGLRPISIKAVRSFEIELKHGFFDAGINIVDKIFLTKYLALMLKVGTDLFQAINVLIADFDKPALKALLLEVRSTLEQGKPFYITFAKYPNIFSSVFVNMVKAGEASGNLETIFGDLSHSLEKERDLHSRFKAALVYPIILLIASFLVLFFLVAFAIPRIAGIFVDAGVKPPLFSRVVFGIGTFMGDNIIFIIVLLIVLVAGGILVVKRSLVFRRFMGRLSMKIPVMRNVLTRIAVQRFAITLSSLMKAGLPILESLEITADAVGNEEIKAALIRISRERIAKGVSIGEAFRREEGFPRVVTNLISIGERAGHIEEILRTLADFYEAEIDASIKVLVSFLEPVLLVGIGGIVGTIALSVIIPIYQLVQTGF